MDGLKAMVESPDGPVNARRPPAPAPPLPRSPAPPLPRSTREEDAYAVEFAGWLPCYQFFGNCGNHPQFAHTEAPPAGYRFVRSDPRSSGVAPARRRWGPVAIAGALVRAAEAAVRAVRWAVRQTRVVGVGAVLRTFAAMARLYWTLRRAGCRLGPTLRFLRSRHFLSQALAPRGAKLMFLTSVPCTFGQRPWIIEIEDATTLFLPHLVNGSTYRTRIRRSPYLPAVKALLESDACRGVVTHMRSTAESMPKLFGAAVAAKTTYVPCGTALPPVGQSQKATDHCDLLFTCSWHQLPVSFYLRGGLDVLRAFEVVQERYPHVRLTLRTGVPRDLKPRFRQVLEKCWVRVIDRYLPPEDMDELMRGSHLFLLPAARIHVVSVLRAMAYGQVVVASDGWGFNEYVEHGRNGLIVPGRHGRVSWMDEETGLLREDYEPMHRSDSAVTAGLVEAISTLVEDHELRRRLGGQARHDVATRFTLENWNRGLKRALDQATGRAG
jgi:hypothetical protein